MDDQILDEGLRPEHKSSIESTMAILRLRREYEEQFKQVKHGRYAIIGLIVIMSIAGIYETVTYDFDSWVAGINGAVVAMLIGCYVLSLKKPLYGFIGALVVLLGLTLITGYFDPINFVKGFLWKIIIILYLVSGMSPAKKLPHTVKSLSSYGIEVEES